MLYHILGLLSSLVFILTWAGLVAQIRRIYRQGDDALEGNSSLSLNQFGSSYFAFFSMFIFGIAVEPFNHYLVWTRCGACLLTLVILVRLWRLRRNRVTAAVSVIATIALIAGFVSMGFRPFPALAQLGTNALMLIVTVILVQGTLHQWLLLRKQQKVGSLSAGLFYGILAKDISTLLFGLAMPFAQAWPLLVLSGASVITRGAVLLQIKWLQKQQVGCGGVEENNKGL